MKISIVTPTLNDERHLYKLLGSLVAQTYTNFEVVIIDGESTDDTINTVKSFSKYLDIKIIIEKKRGIGAARNTGVKKAKGNIIAFIDSDCIAKEDWLETALKDINKGYKLVGGAVKNANPESFISVADHILSFNESLDSMPKREVMHMPTCNLICKKDIFEEIKGFPTDIYAAEDALFVYEASKKFKLLFNPEIIVFHHNRTNLKKFMVHHFRYGRDSARIRKRANLRGNVFAKYPLLALLAPFVRFLRISSRIVKWNLKKLPQFILVLPIILLGISSWSYGFMRSSFGR